MGPGRSSQTNLGVIGQVYHQSPGTERPTPVSTFNAPLPGVSGGAVEVGRDRRRDLGVDGEWRWTTVVWSSLYDRVGFEECY